ncbi:MAG TPA: pyrimidine 5'-nucleotidase [Acidobacteriota bacterium]|nr:pyrimidine 5'-nucleotidase [Acidobacteriota bacterium]
MNKALRCAFFDLDNTLYPNSSGVMQAIGSRINRFMVERLDIKPEEVTKIRDDYLKIFGTTLNALRRFYDVDPDEYLNFVHDLPLHLHLQYDPELDRMLERMEFRKIIFTNADAKHARRVLSLLGILRHFESIIDIHTLDFVNKPGRRAYFKALEFASAGPEECLLVEDSIVNIIPAAELGMTTVLVREGPPRHGAHHHIRRITELVDLLDSIE